VQYRGLSFDLLYAIFFPCIFLRIPFFPFHLRMEEPLNAAALLVLLFLSFLSLFGIFSYEEQESSSTPSLGPLGAGLIQAGSRPSPL
jgi:hypothetical protein